MQCMFDDNCFHNWRLEFKIVTLISKLQPTKTKKVTCNAPKLYGKKIIVILTFTPSYSFVNAMHVCGWNTHSLLRLRDNVKIAKDTQKLLSHMLAFT